MRLILGTAGHIDHGKTALVRALTGIDTDRLPEEKQRGITIDLGFANLHIGDVSFGIVDVPGHEDFIRNMLAGATGMDAVLLVVAADEGVMPQTREHLAILDLLDVQRGVVAITKADLVDGDWLELVADDVRQLLATTSLRGIPVVAVSSVTGRGLDELRAAIVEQATRGDARAADDLLRMPVDRVFTVRGTGTVVTGTVWSGRIRPDETVRILPVDSRARVRGVQVHGASVASAQAGERAAIALSGAEKSALSRGDVVVSSDEWMIARMLTARMRVIPGTEWLLQNRQRVHVHLGTAEVLARAVLLDRGMLQPGEQGWVQLRLESPLVARVGDRIVLRSYSPVTTIAGGVLADISDRKRTRIGEAEATVLLAAASPNPREAVTAVIAASGASGVRAGALAMQTPHSPASVQRALREIGADVVAIGERWFARDVVATAVQETIAAVEALHAQSPLRPALERAEVRASLRGAAGELIEHAIDTAVQQDALRASGNAIARAGFQPKLTARQIALKQSLVETLRTAGLAPPTASELATSLGGLSDVSQLLRLLVHEGSVAAVAPDLFMDRETLDAARARTRAALAGGQKLSAAEFRATLPVSRKHLIPILEYFDRTGVTLREGDLRIVLPG